MGILDEKMSGFRMFKDKLTPIEKELLAIEKKENKLWLDNNKLSEPSWKNKLESKIPDKVYDGLENAFCKGFSVVFQKGKIVIEKTYNKQERLDDYKVRDFAVNLRQNRKNLRQMGKATEKSDLLNIALTTTEGIALGALGIGMPDIVLFLSTLLKGIYECALSYGYDYESPSEQLFILKMMETALSNGEKWQKENAKVDEFIMSSAIIPTKEELDKQIKMTASVFAMDMLLLKFIQGIPIVGVLGGVANPVYYHKIMNYVRLKYRKRYLVGKNSNKMD